MFKCMLQLMQMKEEDLRLYFNHQKVTRCVLNYVKCTAKNKCQYHKESTYKMRFRITIVFAGDFTQLLTTRREDTSKDGFKDWPFTSVHFWGTNPNGRFHLHTIYDVS